MAIRETNGDHMLHEYRTTFARYALETSSGSEDFFQGISQLLEKNIMEIDYEIYQRDRVGDEVLEEIDAERRRREQEARFQTDTSWRLFLSKQVDSLAREARAERIRRVGDVAAWKKERRSRMEELGSLVGLFKERAVTQPGDQRVREI